MTHFATCSLEDDGPRDLASETLTGVLGSIPNSTISSKAADAFSKSATLPQALTRIAQAFGLAYTEKTS